MDYRCETSVVSEDCFFRIKIVESVKRISFCSSASLNELKILIVNDDSVSSDMQPNVINGNLVYLCQSKADDTDDILECYGLGTFFVFVYSNMFFSVSNKSHLQVLSDQLKRCTKKFIFCHQLAQQNFNM